MSSKSKSKRKTVSQKQGQPDRPKVSDMVAVKDIPPTGRRAVRSPVLLALMKSPGQTFKVATRATSKKAAAVAKVIKQQASGDFEAVSRMTGPGKYEVFATYKGTGAGTKAAGKKVAPVAAKKAATAPKAAPKSALKGKARPTTAKSKPVKARTRKPAAPVAADPAPEPEPEPEEVLPEVVEGPEEVQDPDADLEDEDETDEGAD